MLLSLCTYVPLHKTTLLKNLLVLQFLPTTDYLHSSEVSPQTHDWMFLLNNSLFGFSSFWYFCVNQATGYASQQIWCLSQARINWEGCVRKGIQHKNGGDGRGGAPISLDGVAVHPDCWCICLRYLHFARENPEAGKMYLLVLAHPGCPGQSSDRHKMVVVVL